MNYIPVIGLEIHCELLTRSKVFCTCENGFGSEPNTRICPRCAALPGALPLLNREAVYLAAKAGLALNCTIQQSSAFDRKNYFYPDLPKAYQITQFAHPICTDGHVILGSGKAIRVNRIHIEEDAGKLIHDSGGAYTSVDLNRCGVPLIEIVTAPDFRSGDEVCDFVRRVALALKYTDVCDARMEQGSLRVDVNISVMEEGAQALGTRAEIKNLNSTRAIMRAVGYETERQIKLLSGGGSVKQETRRYDDSGGKTYAMRGKEGLNDYRYFPEPDIPPICISDREIDDIRKSMPELPDARFRRYTEEYGISADDAALIISDRDFSDFYDSAATVYKAYRQVASLMLVELNRNLNESHTSVRDLRFSPSDLAETAKMASDGVISNNAAREIVRAMFREGKDPRKIAEEQGFIMISDNTAMENAIVKVLRDNEKLVLEYINGNDKLFGFLMGRVIHTIGNGANPKLVRELLSERLNDLKS